MSQAVQRSVGLISSTEIIVEQKTLPLTEHLWIYLDFSTDETFKDPEQFLFPDAGEYDYLVSSNNGVTYKEWFSGMKVTENDYEPIYHIAGLVTHVKALMTIPVTKTFAPGHPQEGLDIFVRVTTSRV